MCIYIYIYIYLLLKCYSILCYYINSHYLIHVNRPHTLQYAGKMYCFRQIVANIVTYKDSKPTM